MVPITTTILISNLHCSSCVNTIRETLTALNPPPTSVHTSIVSQSVAVEHTPELSVVAIKQALDEAGFDLVTTPQLESLRVRRPSTHFTDWVKRKREKHAEQCLLCKQETTFESRAGTSNTLASHVDPFVKIPPHVDTFNLDAIVKKTTPTENEGPERSSRGDSGPFIATFAIGGMTCASCTANISELANSIPGVSNVVINLLGKSASATLNEKGLVDAFIGNVEDGGYNCDLISIEPVKVKTTPKDHPEFQGPLVATFSIGGMTCASCVANVSNSMSELDGVSNVTVNLVGKFATAILENRDIVKTVIDAVEDSGYDAELVTIESAERYEEVAGPRTVSLRVDGMFCHHCPEKVLKALESFGNKITVDDPLKTFDDPKPILRITYTPSLPSFSLRHIISAIASAKSPPFQVSIAQPLSLEERAKLMHAREQRALLLRLVSAVIIAIPTFIIGIVYMTLVPSHNETRMFIMRPMWTGNASRAQWAMFFLATPVMFYSAGQFHHRSLKELLHLWKRGSKTPIWRRFVRFGSMNLLVSMGVSIAYFASIALLALASSQSPSPTGDGDSTTYFDSVVFLTMFLLAGRFLEAYSKGRTSDAITALGKLRPSEALLLVPADEVQTEATVFANSDTDLEKGDGEDDESLHSEKPGMCVQKVNVDVLEIGDVVRVPLGSTPPADGVIVSPGGSQFDESSLTGESRPIKKIAGDAVFVGTINRGRVVEVKVTKLGGETMLDQIVKVVREGQAKRAPIERLVDVLTGYFVPIITLLAILTWVVWLALGLSGILPQSYLDIPIGGWPVWALEFAIAVFVVACPCGIGLAAPTALLVGSGLAAKYGILVRGGGEAFQEAAQLDIVVFDKTGTLTEGGEPCVTNTEEYIESTHWTRADVLSIVHELENASSHPLAVAVRKYCEDQKDIKLSATSTSIDETGGRGLKGSFSAPKCIAIIGNEEWIEEHGASVTAAQERLLEQWKSEGKSVILAALSSDKTNDFTVVSMFAAADTLRPEASGVVQALQKQGLGTWMISGDNPTTAKAVAKMIGIPETNVIAGVLPHQKAEKIEWLQQVGTKREPPKWKQLLGLKPLNERCIVAMVGDGINDAPALTTADVGIAIGSGSDVAISSASFILVKSDLRSILTLTDLSRRVFNRVKFNFFWALVYNICALPIAAGAIYPAGHARLDPVWASLAMALSSVTVVASSLMLRLYREPKIELSQNQRGITDEN